MPFWAQLILVILITAYFVFKFVKERQVYQILFVLWVPSILLQFVSDNKIFIYCLAAYQLIMFLLVVFFMFRKKGERVKKTYQILAEAAADRLPDSHETSAEDNVSKSIKDEFK